MNGREWAGAVVALALRSARPAGARLIWTVPAALPAAALIGGTAAGIGEYAGHCCQSGAGGPGLALAILVYGPVVLPMVIGGGYLIACLWASALGVTGGQDSRCRHLLWAAYLIAVIVMVAAAGGAAYLMTNDGLVRDVLITAGPLGLPSLAVLLAPGRVPARPARGKLLVTAGVVAVYQIAIGLAVSSMINAAHGTAVIGLVLALALSVPGTLVLIAASQVMSGG
jgi:hypothetical protein